MLLRNARLQSHQYYLLRHYYDVKFHAIIATTINSRYKFVIAVRLKENLLKRLFNYRFKLHYFNYFFSTNQYCAIDNFICVYVGV